MNCYRARRQSALPLAIGFLGLLAGVAPGLMPRALSQETSPAPAATPAATPASAAAATNRPTLNLGSQGPAVSELQSLLKLLGFYRGVVDGQYQASTAEAVSAFQQAVNLQPDGIVGSETWSRLLPAPPPIQQAATPVVPSPVTPVTPSPAAPSPVAPNPALPSATPSPTVPTPSPGSRPSFPTPTVSPAPAPTPAPTPASPAPAPAPTPSPTPAPTPAPGYTPVTPAPTAPTAPTTENPVLRVGSTGDAVTRLQERLRAVGVFSGTIDGVFGAETEAAVQAAQRQFNLEPDGVVGPATWEALLRR